MKKLFFVISFIGLASFVAAQGVSCSAKINEMFSVLPLDCKNKIDHRLSSNFNCMVYVNEIDIKVVFNSEGKLTHIGLNLFTFDKNLVFTPEVLTYIERSLLDYLMINELSVIKKKMAEEKIEIRLNGKALGESGFSSITDIMYIIQSQFDFLLDYDGSVYKAVFKRKIGELEMTFPGNNNLITGMDKKEYGEYIAHSLETHETSGNPEHVQPYASSLVKYKDNINVSVGDSYYKSISSSKYYSTNESDSAWLLFAEENVLESFTNCFLEPFEANENMTLQIRHKVYGDEILNYEVSLQDFLLYFRDDFTSYFGIETTDDNHLTGTLILYNKALNFINLLSVQTSKKDLFGDKPVIQASFYTNIPSDNIKNLFAEFENDSN